MKTDHERGDPGRWAEPPTAGTLADPTADRRTNAEPTDGIDIEGSADAALDVFPPFDRPLDPPEALSVGPGACTVAVSPDVPLEHVFRQLVAAYLDGADEFLVVESGGLRPSTRELARTFARRTFGPLVVSQGTEQVLLRISAEASHVDLTRGLRRMYELVARLQQSANAYLTTAGPIDPTELGREDDEVDRQAWLVERMLGRRLRSPPPTVDASLSSEPIPAILLARALERVADHAVTLGACAARLSECSVPDGVRVALRTYHLQVMEHLRNAFEVAGAPDVTRANELLDTGDALHATHATLSEKLLARASSPGLAPVASASLGLALQSIDRTTSYAQDIAQVGLDRAMALRIRAADLGGPGRRPRDRREVDGGPDESDGDGSASAA
jgi:phosphate uptake regulator